MSAVDTLASIQQLRAVFQGLAGSSGSGTGAIGSGQTASSADFDSLIAALGASGSSVTATATTALTSSATGAVSASTVPNPDGVTGADVVADAMKYVGVPYVFGGESTSGMDCSGLVQKTYADLGISLTRGVSTQKLQGTAVASLADAQPGDLIVFKGGGHVAIYAGNDMVIHAPYPGRTVSLQKLWVGDSGIETIRRIVPSASSSTAATPSTSATSTGSTVTLAQAQAALTAAQQAVMQADLAMMSSTTDPTSDTSDTDTAFTGADSSVGATGGTAPSDGTDAIQQFISTQEALMSQGAA